MCEFLGGAAGKEGEREKRTEVKRGGGGERRIKKYRGNYFLWAYCDGKNYISECYIPKKKWLLFLNLFDYNHDAILFFKGWHSLHFGPKHFYTQ